MARPPKKRTGKSADSIFRQTAPSQVPVSSQDAFRWDGYQDLDTPTRDTLIAATRDIHQRLKRTVQDVYAIGKRLIQVKALLADRTFGQWFSVEFGDEFGITLRLAEHWMNVGRRFSEEQIERFTSLRMPLSALYQVAAPSTPTDTPDRLLDKLEEERLRGRSRKIKADEVFEIIQAHKQEAERALKTIQLREAGIIPEAQTLLLSTPVAENAKTLRFLGRFSPEIQTQIAQKLSKGEARNVRQANRLLIGESAPAQHHSELGGSTPSVTFSDRAHYTAGPWSGLISQLLPESIDFCFVEAPFEHEFLPTYSQLAAALFRVLKPGAKVLLMAGHRNIQFLGPCLEPPLRVSWTHAVWREPGRSPRVLGPNVASGSVLLSLAYREPWVMPTGLVEDARTEAGLEAAVYYYLSRYTHHTDTVLHLITDPLVCSNLSSTLMQAAHAFNHGRLIGLGAHATQALSQ